MSEKNRKKLEIKAILPNGSAKDTYTLYLLNKKDKLLLPIIIGKDSALILTQTLQTKEKPRPNIFDTIKGIIYGLKGKFVGTNIYLYKSGIYYTSLIFENNGKEVLIDGKLTDCIAIAIKMRKPIYAEQKLLEKQGIHITKRLLEESLQNS